jgi:fructose-bisphosphate aldolase, class I
MRNKSKEMTTLGKQIRLNRIFSHPSGRILSVAVDHLVNYPIGMPAGLRNIQPTLRQIVEGRPDAITMMKGLAKHCWSEYAGRVPLIIQQMATRPDVDEYADVVTVEECVSMGADAIAVAVLVKGRHQMRHTRQLASVVQESESYGLPVITHIYPVDPEQNKIVHTPEEIFYAVRVGMEMGADVIKTPYTGDVNAFRDIVASVPVPVVCAGGPRCETMEEVEAMLRDVAKTGAAGATVGRNVWGFPDIPQAVQRLRRAICG